MIVVCRSCDLVLDLDLRVKRRPPEATILMALRDVKCPRCNGHGRPEVVRLAMGARRAVGLISEKGREALRLILKN